MAGPLTGMKVIEMAGIGPGPFCAMVLADLAPVSMLFVRCAGVARCSGVNTRLISSMSLRTYIEALADAQAKEGRP